jgi:membrane-bound ClpP family serine protease
MEVSVKWCEGNIKNTKTTTTTTTQHKAAISETTAGIVPNDTPGGMNAPRERK